uniref:Retrotransposon gag domain-containing protein n=1 Tax=Fagus sylvatica TaxID=28930 RepID=A0A2N9HFX3_FAGSY
MEPKIRSTIWKRSKKSCNYKAVPEEIMGKAFPMGLRGSARVWFNKLESESIGSFIQLSRTFIDHFIGGQRKERPPTHLLNVKQMKGESLRAYMHRFNKEAMQIDCPKEDVTLTAFMAGLRKGDFLYNLCKDPPKTLSELMYEAQKHMNAEDAIESRDNPPQKRRKDVDDRKQELTKQKVPKFSETLERKRTTVSSVKFNSFTPLNTPIDQLLMQIQDDPTLRWPDKIHSDPDSRPKNLYYRFHRDHGHLTENCMALKEQVETLIRSADILYLPAYQQMKLDKEKLRPMEALLVGFTCDKICPFPTEHGIGEVRGDQIAAKECYLASLGTEGKNQKMTIEERKTLVEPSEELNTVILNEEHPEKSTRIGVNLPPLNKRVNNPFLEGQ